MGLFDSVKNLFKGGSGKLSVFSPVDGKIISQKDIPDFGFSEGHMGTGVGIVPSNGKVSVYMDGELVVLYKTKHAYFIKDQKTNISVMLHFGINTVEIPEEKGAFITGRQQGDVLRVGGSLCEADLSVIEQEGKSTTSALLIQNENMENRKIEFHKKPGDVVKSGDLLMTIH